MKGDMRMTIDEEFSKLIPPLTEEEYRGLEASIINEGCRDALVIWNDTLIDGHNRYKICREHNVPFETVQREFKDRNDVLLWIINNQLSRRNLPKYVYSVLALKKEPIIAAMAKENQIASGGAVPQKSARPIETRKELAKIAGVSHDTIAKVKKIETVATPEMKAELRNGNMSINQAYQHVKHMEKEAHREEARQQNAEKVQAISNPLDAQGLFQTIVIDPAWDYSEEGDNDAFGRIKPNYHTMSIEEIEALPIARIADENCHLYIWVTNRTFQKGFRLFEAWGFRYITCLTWVKPHFGVGNYFRSQTEHVLFGVRGSQPLKRHDIGTWFEAPCREHSEKPDEFYRLVESCSYAPYIDIFGRKEREGWTVWGENA